MTHGFNGSDGSTALQHQACVKDLIEDLEYFFTQDSYNLHYSALRAGVEAPWALT